MLHHIALGASNVAAIARFYREVFGLHELRRHNYGDGRLRSIWLDLGGAVLMVEDTDAEPHRVDGVGHGPFLLAFEVAADDRAERERELKARGVVIEDRTEHSSYFRDPEGNRVAISSYPLSEETR